MSLMLRKYVLVIGVFLLAGSVFGQTAGNWPKWRGPSDSGSADSGTLPAKWDANTNLVWRVALPGKGCSTPIVWDQRIILTAPVQGQDAVQMLDWSGKLVWQTVIGPERKGKHVAGSGCNPSATTDGQGIFVYYKSGTLARVDFDGKVRWKTNLQERYGKDSLYWDIGTSPVLTEKDVVVAVMHHGESFLAAFDKVSGELHWRALRNYETPEEGDHSYATPLVIKHEGKEALLAWGGLHLTAHDAADGKIIWSCQDFNPKAIKNWVPVASPVIAGDMVVLPFGRGMRLHGIKLGGSGEVTATHRIWNREDTGSFVPTPAVQGGKVYLLRDRGEIECIDPVTGKTIWSGSLPKDGPAFYSSPTVVDGKIYIAREDGTVFVVSTDGKCTILGENKMGERIIASPVPVGNRLLIRGEKNLYCIGQ